MMMGVFTQSLCLHCKLITLTSRSTVLQYCLRLPTPLSNACAGKFSHKQEPLEPCLHIPAAC